MTPWVIGNWKMHPATQVASSELITSIITKMNSEQGCHIMVAPSYIHLGIAASLIYPSTPDSDAKKQTSLKLASQDVTVLNDATGAYTGDVSAIQLKDIGVEWVIVGHSERRQYYGENNQTLIKKMQHCAEHGLGVIFCIGESETDYETGATKTILKQQLSVIKSLVNECATKSTIKPCNLIIAYEPVWAIGTGKIPSVQQIASIHTFIREQLVSYNNSLIDAPIIYGGSVKPDNVAEFASCPEINGVLVGGAALSAQGFLQIAKAFS